MDVMKISAPRSWYDSTQGNRLDSPWIYMPIEIVKWFTGSKEMSERSAKLKGIIVELKAKIKVAQRTISL